MPSKQRRPLSKNNSLAEIAIPLRLQYQAASVVLVNARSPWVKSASLLMGRCFHGGCLRPIQADAFGCRPFCSTPRRQLHPVGCQTKAAVAMSTGVLVRWKCMSVDHGSLSVKGEAPFLHVRPGHFVIVGGDHLDQGGWWMGQVIFCEGSARHPRLPSLFQVADVDTGVIKWINADEVSDVIWSMDGWPATVQ